MRKHRSEIVLTREEVEILLLWAERATRGVYQGCGRYLGESECRLLARLEELRTRLAAEASEG